MRFAFIAKHRSIWPVMWLCKALDVSRSGFHAWMNRTPAKRTLENEGLARVIRQSFIVSDRTYGARRVWHDVLAEGFTCGLHRIERLMRLNALKARPRRRYLPPDVGASAGSAPLPPMCLIDSSMRQFPIQSGLLTLPISGQLRAGFMSRPSLICSQDVLLVGP